MYKHMQEIKNKDWSKMQAYFNWNKDKYAPALKAMEDYKDFDFHKMFLEDSDLFVFFVRIHSESNGKYNVENFWNLYYQAYQHLKNDGVLDINLTEKKLQLVKDFQNKLDGPNLISKKDLEDTMTIKKKNKEVSVHFDYLEVLALIEKHYDIKVRRFFDKLKYETKREIFSQYFSIEDYQKYSNISPVDSLEANYLSIISDVIDEQIEYIDYWHYMLEYDFTSVSNGSICSMWFHDSEEDSIEVEDIIHTKKEFQEYISEKIKKAFFKELSQLKEVDLDEEGIEFLIEW